MCVTSWPTSSKSLLSSKCVATVRPKASTNAVPQLQTNCSSRSGRQLHSEARGEVAVNSGHSAVSECCAKHRSTVKRESGVSRME